MVCQRCSHPLPPLAERCLRCSAVTAPEAGVAFSIESDPPPAAPDEIAPTASAPQRPAASAQLLAWGVDLALVVCCAALHVAVATAFLRGMLRSQDAGLDVLLRGPRLPLLWTGLCALLAVAYSWLFTALGGRTPGLALAGLRLESQRGGALSLRTSLGRAALAVPSAAIGLAGFALALVDPRGQTLHDKLCGSVVVAAGPAPGVARGRAGHSRLLPGRQTP
jgi:uncharacterized RDD family membrane protein YckC